MLSLFFLEKMVDTKLVQTCQTVIVVVFRQGWEGVGKFKVKGRFQPEKVSRYFANSLLTPSKNYLTGGFKFRPN
jgi:hypothetical protein